MTFDDPLPAASVVAVGLHDVGVLDAVPGLRYAHQHDIKVPAYSTLHDATRHPQGVQHPKSHHESKFSPCKTRVASVEQSSPLLPAASTTVEVVEDVQGPSAGAQRSPRSGRVPIPNLLHHIVVAHAPITSCVD